MLERPFFAQTLALYISFHLSMSLVSVSSPNSILSTRLTQLHFLSSALEAARPRSTRVQDFPLADARREPSPQQRGSKRSKVEDAGTDAPIYPSTSCTPIQHETIGSPPVATGSSKPQKQVAVHSTLEDLDDWKSPSMFVSKAESIGSHAIIQPGQSLKMWYDYSRFAT